MVAVILMAAIAVVLAAVVYTWTTSLAGTDADSGQPGGCSQDGDNFVSIGTVPRLSDRNEATYRLADVDTGDTYIGTSHDDASSPAADAFEHGWSGTRSSSIRPGEVLRVVEQPGGSGGTEWDDGDRFTLEIRDQQGTLMRCPFTWTE